MRSPLIAFALTLTLAAAAALSAGAAVAATAAERIRIDTPYARAVPPGQPNSAVFMVLQNEADVPRALVAAESDAAATIELHTHRMADGMMQMRRIERIELPPGELIELKPGGLHVMLIGLTEQLAPGGAVALTLIFDDGSRAEITAPVQRVMPMSQEHGGGH
jgi:copper(I)-binding protein